MRILPLTGDNYTVKGGELQVVEINLDGKIEVVAEAGNLFFMTEYVRMEAKVDGDGILGTIGNVLRRKIAGESAFLTRFYGNGTVSFSSERMGKVIPVLLENEELFAQRDSFLCGMGEVNVDFTLQKSLSGGLFGGEGFVLEKITGSGIVFLNATGFVEVRELENETIMVETAKAVAWSEGINYDIEIIRDVKTAIFGDEGLFLTKLSGSGTVILQSVDFETLKRKILGNCCKDDN